MGALLFLAAAWWWAVRLETPGAAPGAGADRAQERARARFDKLRAQLDAASQTPPPGATGSLEIGGRVVGAGGPVAFATVTVTRSGPREALAEMPCLGGDGDESGVKLLDRVCGEAASQLVDLIVERRDEARPVARATSDAEGRFKVAGLAEGSYALWADTPEGAGVSSGVAAGSSGVEIAVASGMKLHGRVVDARDRPIPGAVVTAIPSGHTRFFDTLSAADGAFTVGPLPPGLYAVVALSESLLPDHARVRLGGDRDPVVLTLHAPRRLRGRVLRGQAPAAGVAVTLEGRLRMERVVTGGDGRFELGQLRPGDYHVSARQGTLQAAREVTVPRLADPPGLALSLERGGALSGTVRARSGEALFGATVELLPRDREGRMKLPVAPDGTFRAEVLAPGKVWVRASAKGFQKAESREVLVHAGEVTSLEFTLDPGAVVEGTVLGPSGAPVAGARVSPDGERKPSASAATTDEHGHFSLDGLAPGPVTLFATHDDYLEAVAAGAAPSAGLVLRLGAAEAVDGRVVTDSGAPVAGAQVYAFRGELTQVKALRVSALLEVRKTWTDSLGAFHLRGVQAGPTTVAVSRGESIWSGQLTTLEIDVPAPGPVTVTLGAAGIISGSVVDRAGRPLEGAQVWAAPVPEQVEPDELAFLRRGRAVSTASGAFELFDLEPREYELSAQLEGHKEAKARARVGERTVRLELDSAPVIRGRVLRSSGEPVVVFLVNGAQVEDPAGEFTISRHEVLETFVAIDAGKDLAPASRSVPAGTTDVSLGDIVLGSGRKVTGRVLDAQTGAGIAGAAVVSGDARDRRILWWWGVMESDQSELTAPDGSFVLPHVGEQAPAVFASHADYDRASAPLGSSDRIELRLWHVTRIVGEVQGRLAGGALVTAWDERGAPSRSAEVDPSGHFAISGLTGGRYIVRVRTGLEETLFPPVQVEVPSHGEARVTLVESSGGATLRVRGPGNEAVAIMFLVPGAAQMPSTSEGLNGLFVRGLRPAQDGEVHTFRRLPAGTFTLFVLESDGNVGRARVAMVPVAVLDGQDQTVEVSVPRDAPTIDL